MSKKLTDFFKPKVSSTSSDKTVNKPQGEHDEESAIAPSSSESSFNKSQSEVEEVSRSLETQYFHPPSDYVFPTKRIGDRDRSCQHSWFKDFPWLRYDERFFKN